MWCVADVRLIDGCDEDRLEGLVRLLVCLEFIKLILVPTSDVRYLQTSGAGGDHGVLGGLNVTVDWVL